MARITTRGITDGVLHAAMAVATSCAGAAQAPRFEVLSEPGQPSSLLTTHLEKHAEEFVLVDVGLWVSALVGDTLGGTWRRLEDERSRMLADLLLRIGERTKPPRGPEDVLAGVCHVAAVLLHGDVANGLPEPWRSEFVAVCQGARAARSWARPSTEVDWSIAVPDGAYANDAMRGLFRTTIWLRESVQALPPDLAATWQQLVHDAMPTGSRQRIADIDSALGSLFGTGPGPMPLVIGGLQWADVADRVALAAASGPWWQRLQAVHRQAPTPRTDLRTSIFGVAHELATEAPDDGWLDAWGSEGWRHRRLDLADFAYVAVREVEAIVGAPGVPPKAVRPRLLVDPLPRTFAALRAAFLVGVAAQRAVHSGKRGERFASDMDDCLALLSHQRAGTEPGEELVARLWDRLQHAFGMERADLPEVRLEGIEGSLRRTQCRLVRIPIRWQGRDSSVVAFDWGVEHRGAENVWQRAQRTAPALDRR